MALALTKKTKVLLALAPVALVLLFVGYEALRVWWYRGYSKGSRTGIILKVTEKGPPYCKYLEAEMKVGGNATMAPESWHFSVDDDSPTSAVVIALKAAEKKQATVTVDYRQDLHSLFRCAETEYFVTKVEN
jgi:hypothetical protein